MDTRDQTCRRASNRGCCLLVSALLLAGGAAHAENVNSIVQLQLTVLSQSNCKFTTLPPTQLSFGLVDPSSTTAATAQISAVFECKGSAPTAVYAITADNGLYYSGSRRMRHTNATNYLPYSIALAPASGTVAKNTPVNLTITGTISVADFQNAIAGDYSDTVVVTVQP